MLPTCNIRCLCLAFGELLSEPGILMQVFIQVLIASYAEDEIQNRYYLTPFPVKAALEVPGMQCHGSL